MSWTFACLVDLMKVYIHPEMVLITLSLNTMPFPTLHISIPQLFPLPALQIWEIGFLGFFLNLQRHLLLSDFIWHPFQTAAIIGRAQIITTLTRNNMPDPANRNRFQNEDYSVRKLPKGMQNDPSPLSLSVRLTHWCRGFGMTCTGELDSCAHCLC